MSAKNRGSKVVLFDRYLTPRKLVEAACIKLKQAYPTFEPFTCLEPGCAWGSHLDYAIKTFPSIIYSVGVDIEEDTKFDSIHKLFVADYLTWNHSDGLLFDLIITNPPFSLTDAFVRRILIHLSPNGLAMILQRDGYYTTYMRRWSLLRNINIRNRWTTTRRPRFIRQKSGDATEYAYFVFDGGVPGPTLTDWLDW